MRWLWLVLLLGLLPNLSFADEATVASGIGTETCGKFAEDYRRSPAKVEAVYFTWAQGFMTGRNVALAMSNQSTHDLHVSSTISQRASIRSYCDAHPLNFYFIAVLDLFESLPLKAPPKNAN
jgi:hypothetical protein